MTTSHRSKKKLNKSSSKGLHPRNIHRDGYDFLALVKCYSALRPYVKTNEHGKLSIDFAEPFAVKALNAALLKHHYNIRDWDIPEAALCPPIPGRVDYIHYIAELLNIGEPRVKLVNEPSKIKLLDIGTGANGIYSLLAAQLYGWQSVASDINSLSLENVSSIIANNPQLKGRITLRRQRDKNHIFDGIIQEGEFFDVSVCNPPFHDSLEEALKGSQRKVDNLARNRGEQLSTKHTKSKPSLNFGGIGAELWCKGGEHLFLKKMFKESKTFSTQCRWFTSLVSKFENVKPAIKLLGKLGATEVREIEMVQGNKVTRIVAWTFSNQVS